MPGTLVAHSPESDFSIEMLTGETLEWDANELESLITAKTHNTIRNLRVTVRDGCVIVTGKTSRYYHKQLASQAILEQQLLVNNAIEVY